MTWQKPGRRPDGCPEEAFAALPDTFPVRLIRLHVTAQGFRPRPVVIVTTLLDAVLYPADALRTRYGECGQVELHFHPIKPMLARDVLRGKSPALILREVALHGIASNFVRSLLQQSAHRHRVPRERLRFKGMLDAVHQGAAGLAAAGGAVRRQNALIDELLRLIAGDLVRKRPGRREPRARKRRAQTHESLTHPRHPPARTARRRTASPPPPIPLS